MELKELELKDTQGTKLNVWRASYQLPFFCVLNKKDKSLNKSNPAHLQDFWQPRQSRINKIELRSNIVKHVMDKDHFDSFRP